jgi:hypothetical protein
MIDGYIYCFSNPSMPGILKVGMTERTPELRLRDANSSDTWRPPTPYKIEFAKKVSNPSQKEKTLHTLLEQHTDRINHRREFFRLSKEEVLKFFDLMDGEMWAETREEEEEEEEEEEDEDEDEEEEEEEDEDEEEDDTSSESAPRVKATGVMYSCPPTISFLQDLFKDDTLDERKRITSRNLFEKYMNYCVVNGIQHSVPSNKLSLELNVHADKLGLKRLPKWIDKNRKTHNGFEVNLIQLQAGLLRYGINVLNPMIHLPNGQVPQLMSCE